MARLDSCLVNPMLLEPQDVALFNDTLAANSLQIAARLVRLQGRQGTMTLTLTGLAGSPLTMSAVVYGLRRAGLYGGTPPPEAVGEGRRIIGNVPRVARHVEHGRVRAGCLRGKLQPVQHQVRGTPQQGFVLAAGRLALGAVADDHGGGPGLRGGGELTGDGEGGTAPAGQPGLGDLGHEPARAARNTERAVGGQVRAQVRGHAARPGQQPWQTSRSGGALSDLPKARVFFLVAGRAKVFYDPPDW